MKYKRITSIFKLKVSRKMVGIAVVVLVALQVFFTIQTSAFGTKLAQLEEKRLEIVKQNDEISKTLIESTSLTKIQEESQKLGFSKPSQMIYIDPGESVARLP